VFLDNHILYCQLPLAPLLQYSITPIPNTPFQILFENGDFLVIDKPAHWLMHPTGPPGTGPRTLWHELRDLLAFELTTGGQISLINRLDRETSGLLLVAKNAGTARELVRLTERRKLEKQYLAIVFGWPDRDHFEVDQPILRQGEVKASRIYLKQCVDPAGAVARTIFRVHTRFRHDERRFALLEVQPQTGRTHQIRVHAAYAGFPLVGDKIYGPHESCYLQFIETGWTPALARKLLLNRHALHAARLAFELQGQSFAFQADLPPDLQDFVARGA
jgi:23S rRNA pseudouridine1911/1915/1917 synthase